MPPMRMSPDPCHSVCVCVHTPLVVLQMRKWSDAATSESLGLGLSQLPGISDCYLRAQQGLNSANGWRWLGCYSG